MHDIPFTLDGHSGTLSQVAGAASSELYHIMVGKYYYGQLWKTAQGWRTDSRFKVEELARLVEGRVISPFN